jgi:hypothetical protein
MAEKEKRVGKPNGKQKMDTRRLIEKNERIKIGEGVGFRFENVKVLK